MIGRGLVVVGALILCGPCDNRGSPQSREEIARIRAAREAEDGIPLAEARGFGASNARGLPQSTARPDAAPQPAAKPPVTCESVKRDFWEAFSQRDEKVLAEVMIAVERLCGADSGVALPLQALRDSGVGSPD